MNQSGLISLTFVREKRLRKPITQMNISTFSDDLLGLEEFSKRLEKFIDTEHEFVDGGLVIALSSKYGSGKSTFLNMWRSALIASDKIPNRTVISLNAWESDYIGDPLFSIVSSLVHAFEGNKKVTKDLMEAAKDLAWMGVSVGSQLAQAFSGVNLTEAGEFAEKKRSNRKETPIISDAFSVFEKRREAMISLKKSIQKLIESESKGILFLVDELDRCRPDYAITYLEVIKHIFDIKGAVFVLAADRKQLENSAKTAFGRDLDFEEYYRKFIHREVSLPDINSNTYSKIAKEYIQKYLIREGSRFCFMKLSQSQEDEFGEIMAKLKLTPRQIQNVFRILGHLLATTEDKSGRMYSCLATGSLLMSIFSVAAPGIYNKLGNQTLDPAEAISFLHALDIKLTEFWFLIFATGGGIKLPDGHSIESAAEINGLIINNAQDAIRAFQRDWGHNTNNRFNQIYQKIQQIDQWS